MSSWTKQWNAKNLFTGWEDVNLSEQGINEATRAGEKVRKITLPSM